MMSDRNALKSSDTPRDDKMPLDARVIGWFVTVQAVALVFFGFLFLIGFSYFPSPDTRPALFGTISIISEIQFGIYWFCIGLARAISAYGISNGCKFGWWCLLILSVNSVLDDLAVLPHYKATVLLTTGINFGIITWLLYQRRLYGIGK